MQAILLFKNRIILSAAFVVLRGRWCLLAAKYDLLEEKYVVFPIDVRLGDGEDIIEEKSAEIGQMMTLPVLYTAFQIFDCLNIFGPSLCLINLIGNALSSCGSSLQFLKMRVIGGRCGLNERLQSSSQNYDNLIRVKLSYIKEQWVFANSLNWFDQKCGQFRFGVNQIVMDLRTAISIWIFLFWDMRCANVTPYGRTAQKYKEQELSSSPKGSAPLPP
jgi:hypothetical protein